MSPLDHSSIELARALVIDFLIDYRRQMYSPMEAISLCWSDDGQFLLTGSDDRRLALWRFDNHDFDSASAKRPVRLLETGHSLNIFHGRFFPGSTSLIASCSLDASVRVHDITTSTNIVCSTAHRERVKKLVLPWDCPSLVISCSHDGTIRQMDIRDPASCKSPDILASWSEGINGISGGWNLRPYSLLAGGERPTLSVYDRRRMHALQCGDSTASPCVVAELQGPDPAISDADLKELCVSGVCLSQSGRVGIGSWMNGEGIYAFDIDNPNKPIGPPFKGHANSRTVKEVSFIGLNQEYIASGSDDGNWFAWRLHGPSHCEQADSGSPPSPVDSRLVHVGLEADLEVVNCVQQHPSQCCVVTSGIEDDIKVWRPERAVTFHHRRQSVRDDPRLRQIVTENLSRTADTQGLSNFILTILRRRFPQARNIQRFGSTVVFTRSPSSSSESSDPAVESSDASFTEAISLEVQSALTSTDQESLDDDDD
ncbi:hypothetical protein FOL47_003543 [Perkinsus chesapeaki]|uniref:Uncharacterized protein n=1 Tax=Perkinsus chesapeaki TaxID=330153 RepID=A0A7J6MZN8_PERCH|nr:hypothetical protein FOL47_003543 [Perkinsus chesapeaki]